jgi:hypothetical protein
MKEETTMTKFLGIGALTVVGLIAPSVLTPHFGAATTSAVRPPAPAPCRARRPIVHVRTVTKVVTRVVYRTRTVVKIVPAPTPTATPIPAPANAAIHGGVVVQASNLHQDSGDAVSTPAPGQQYIVVHIVITNQGTQSARYNAYDFQLQDATDHVRHYETFDTTIANTLLGSGSLAAGQIVAGDIAFQVPANETSFTLLWTPDILSDSITVPIT